MLPAVGKILPEITILFVAKFPFIEISLVTILEEKVFAPEMVWLVVAVAISEMAV